MATEKDGLKKPDIELSFGDGSKYLARALARDEDAIVGINKQIVLGTNGVRYLVDYSKKVNPIAPVKSSFISPGKKKNKKGKRR